MSGTYFGPRFTASLRFSFFTIIACSAALLLVACGDDSSGKRQRDNPVPVLGAISPSSATAGSAGFTLSVTGSDFVPASVVYWNGAARTTSYSSATQLAAVIPAADVINPGTAQVTVVTPAPGGGTSAPVAFTVQPVPLVLSSLAPSSAMAGSPPIQLTVTGSGFLSGAVVQWNGSPRETSYVDATRLVASLSAADLATGGIYQARVANPGGGLSTTLPFAVNNPQPTLGSLDPATLLVGSTSRLLTASGSGFLPGAIILVGGTGRPTRYVSATQLTADLTAADVAIARILSVQVRNPEPTADSSNSLDFAVVSPPPAVVELPAPITVGTDGSPPNGPSVNGGLDIEGANAVFASKASNLVSDDTNGAYDLFIRRTCLGTGGSCAPQTTRLLTGSGRAQPDGDSGWTSTSPQRSLAVSPLARHVAFVSAATNLTAGDTNGVDDVYLIGTCLYPWTTNCRSTPLRVSLRSDGSQSTWPSSQPAVDDDARYVVFVSSDPNMVPGDTNGVADVFVRDTCFGATGTCTPSTARVSVASDGAEANGASGEPAFTGRYVAFTSTATNLVPGDTNGVSDVFVRDTCFGAVPPCTPATRRVSVGNNAVQGDGPSHSPRVALPMMGSDGIDYHGRNIAFISSATNLVSGDTNAVADVFVRDTLMQATERVSVAADGSQLIGKDATEIGFIGWDGGPVAYVTAANGAPEDTNQYADVYTVGPCYGAGGCVAKGMLQSRGPADVAGNGACKAPRLESDPFGAWSVSFESEAKNFWRGSTAPTFNVIYQQILR